MKKILHSIVLGDSSTPLLIIHGFLGMANNWKTMGKKWVEEGFQVHLIDQRNHGKSFWDKEFNYEVMTEDLKNYIESKNLSQVVVLGHSMGGKIGMNFANKYPEKIQKLIIADMSPRSYTAHHHKIIEGLYTLNEKTISNRKEAEEHLKKYIFEKEVLIFLLKNLYWKNEKSLALRLNINVIKNTFQYIYKPLEKLKMVKTNTLFLKAENSDYILQNDIVQIKKSFCNSYFITIKNAGHWLHIENPVDFFQEVTKFIKS